ncbi:MAG: dihydrolipoyl dehydrogenase [Nitrosomonadaceae bacterium]|nr:dihydrolipoyl dehydrogenase [Nitrosomonadaceae bacterium]|tara:strand:- start:5661 stop:7418 length:1758 start_codon:yes stop_codon:yes gene_type:complete
MAQLIEIKVPDIGDFKEIPVIEILVHPGDSIEKETSIITLETDKATIDIPSPYSGTVNELKVKIGDTVSQGSIILILKPIAVSTNFPPHNKKVTQVEEHVSSLENPILVQPTTVPHGDIHAEVVVLGAGPGGYTAAFRAADLGKKVILIERYPVLGGVCLNVGCIPSKALLHMAKVITDVEKSVQMGINFNTPKLELKKIRKWKESIVNKLTSGLATLAKKRNVKVVQGNGKFITPNMISVNTPNGQTTVSFEYCIISAGSSVIHPPDIIQDDPRIIDSTGALELEDIPKRMLIIGGGIIGLEMATIYDAFGSKISVVEMQDQLISGADKDLINPLFRRINKRYEAIYLKTKVSKINPQKDGLKVTFEGEMSPGTEIYDRILVAVGRRPNGHAIEAKNAGVHVTKQGFIPVDNQLRTNVPNIFGIGDIVGEPMLAHKATHEGKLAAEIIAGQKAAFDALTIPSVAYTDPEIAWMGLTEIEAKKQGIDYEKASFPWAASGRAIAMGRDEGMTKLLIDKNTRRLLGAGIVGINAGELISEAVLALEMGTDMEDISLAIHPHPTLSETINFAADIGEGSITDLYMPKK